jgi:hypothetical protein
MNVHSRRGDAYAVVINNKLSRAETRGACDS